VATKKSRAASVSGAPLIDQGDGKHVPNFPDIQDLSKRLRFSPQKGRIMLDDRRMILFHVSSLSILRRELIESVGLEAARGILTRIGYQAGARDAELTKKVRHSGDIYDLFLVGPQMLSLEGVVFSKPLNLQIDVQKGHYFGEFTWRDSSENEAHIAAYGIGSQPVCWMQIGYACGFTSTFMGKPILYRELECRGMGHEYCHLIGKPIDEWDAPEDDVRFLQVGEFVTWTPKSPVERVSGIQHGLGDAETLPNTAGIIGISAGFNTVCHMVKKVAPTEATVLFLGESGVGKEIFAQNLHAQSMRAHAPFVAVNCAAIPEHLMESELFGVEKGGFTGATNSRPGRFERANHGTLFLDEIGTLSLTAQGKLLRALQQSEIERVGDTRVRKVDVRLVAATNVDLREAVKAGDFREDLFFRLNVFPISVPPLRDRRDDIPLLMEWFLRRFSSSYRKRITGFRERAVDALLAYDWPGNVRELENIIERAVILAEEGGALDYCHLFTSGEDVRPDAFALNANGVVSPASAQASPARLSDVQQIVGAASGADAPGSGQLPTLADAEAILIRTAVARARGNLSKAARELGITRPKLAYRLRKIGETAGD
jgi:DNA-binding NtrC family response regulator/predicted hydrocarbon binding protein